MIARLSVVLPAFDAAPTIGTAVDALRSGLASVGAVEIVVVDDGSTDRTGVVAGEAGADIVITHGSNLGKGAAVRAGVSAASGAAVAFTDADLAYDPVVLGRMLEMIEAGADVVVGRRVDRSTEPRFRRAGGAVIARVAERLLIGRRFDSQCGVKAFGRPLGVDVVATTGIPGFAFDAELLARSVRRGLAIAEVDVVARPTAGSSVRPLRDGVGVCAELLRLRRQLGAPPSGPRRS